MKSLDLTFKEIDKVVELLKSGKVGVMPTDTIYGIVGSALNPKTVEEIYSLRKRDFSKPMIVLISSLENLKKFDITITSAQSDFLKNVWPNPVSVVLPCTTKNFSYLHRGKNSLAFRMPREENLLKIIREAGPLVAPSANFEGERISQNIDQAKKYFNDEISFYVDEKEISSRPSTVIRLYEDGTPVILREGGFKVEAKPAS